MFYLYTDEVSKRKAKSIFWGSLRWSVSLKGVLSASAMNRDKIHSKFKKKLLNNGVSRKERWKVAGKKLKIEDKIKKKKILKKKIEEKIKLRIT